MRFHASVSASSIIYAPSEAASEGPHPEKSTPLGPGGALSREARTGFEELFSGGFEPPPHGWGRAARLRNGASLAAQGLRTLRNGASPPDSCFLNARHRL